MNDKQAVKKAMRLLELRDRTEKELRDKLKEKGFNEEETDAAIGYVSSYGYLNDEKYTENYIFFNKERKSRRRIAFDLKTKGIPAEIIDRKLEENPYDETGLIRKMLIKRMQKEDPSDPRYYVKLSNYLFGKGFDISDIEKVMSEEDILT